MNTLSPIDAELDRLWRERFGQPLPLRGCPDLAYRVLGLEDRVFPDQPPSPPPFPH